MGASQAPDDSRRSATPLSGARRQSFKPRAEKTRRGNEEVLLDEQRKNERAACRRRVAASNGIAADQTETPARVWSCCTAIGGMLRNRAISRAFRARRRSPRTLQSSIHFQWLLAPRPPRRRSLRIA